MVEVSPFDGSLDEFYRGLEGWILLDPAFRHTYGVYHGGGIAAPEEHSYLGKRSTEQFPTEVHSQLPGHGYVPGSTLRGEVRLSDGEMITDSDLNGLGGNWLL